MKEIGCKSGPGPVSLAANHDFVVAKAFFAIGKGKEINSANAANTTNACAHAVAPVASTHSNIGLIGATVPVGPAGTVMASCIRKDDKTAFNQDAQQ